MANQEFHIKNSLSEDVQYFVYNWNDTAKWIALTSGTVDASDDDEINVVPNEKPESSSKYFVRFVTDSGGELAGGSVSSDGTITLYKDKNGHYHTR